MDTRRGSQTPEYRTVVKCSQFLVDMVKQSYRNLGNVLFAEEFISKEIWDGLRMESISPVDKAASIVSSLIDRIEHDTNSYYKFVKILEREKTWSDLLLEKLNTHYLSLKEGASGSESQGTVKSSLSRSSGVFFKIHLYVITMGTKYSSDNSPNETL